MDGKSHGYPVQYRNTLNAVDSWATLTKARLATRQARPKITGIEPNRK